jgi:hypothetical protein
VDHVACTVNIGDLQASQFGATETCGIQRHQQRALERRRGSFDKTVYFLPAENGRQMQHLLWIRRQIRAPRLPQRLDIEEPQCAEPLGHAVRGELSFAEQIRLILTNVIRAELIGPLVEVSCEILHCGQIGPQGRLRVVPTIEFLDHQLAKIGHNNLLVGGYSRSHHHG